MNTVAVLGAGTMGAGIAQTAAVFGWRAAIHDVDAGRLRSAVEGVFAALQKLADKGRLSQADAQAAAGRIAPVADPAELASAELCIEAVPEDLELKRSVFAAVARHARPDMLYATNTSSLSVAHIAADFEFAPRVFGLHFFNPVPLMPLVEVIAAPDSLPEAVERGIEVVRSWGKTPVRAADTPGFIVNRVARGYYLEAMRMLAEGVATLDEIDVTMKRLGGFRMGPFELMDLVGIDVNYTVSQSVWTQLGRPARLTPSPLQKQLFESGHLGRKSRRGWYVYDGPLAIPAVTTQRRSFTLDEPLYAAVRRFRESATSEDGSITEQYIFARTLAAIINEAAFSLDEAVASREDIDTAMKLGTNYPAGPLEWAERIGRRTTRALLESLSAHADDGRFAPADWLRA